MIDAFPGEAPCDGYSYFLVALIATDFAFGV